MTNSLTRFHPITLLCLSVVQNRPNLKKKILYPKKIVPAVLPSKIILSQTPPHKETILCIVDYQPITAVLPIAPSMTVMMYRLKASQAVDILVVADLPLQAGYQVPVPAVGVQVGQGRGTKEEGGGGRGVPLTIPYLDLGRGHMDPHVPGHHAQGPDHILAQGQGHTDQGPGHHLFQAGLTAETGAGVHGDTVDLEVGVGVCLDRGVWQRGRNKEKQRRLRK